MSFASLVIGAYLQNSRSVDLAHTIKRDMIPLSSVDPSKPLDDLKPLSQLLKGVDIVGIGEATHGTSEFCSMKHRMFRYLVEEQGFTVFGLEASMPDCIAMDDYVLHGKGDPKAAVIAQGFWTWSTQEVLDLIQWMRAYNLNPKHTKKLRVVGYDMQSQVGVTLYFEKKEKELGVPGDGNFWEAMSWYPLDQESRATIRTKMDGLVKLIGEKQGKEEQKKAQFVEDVYFQAERKTWAMSLVEISRKVIPTMLATFNDAAKLSADLNLTSGEVFDALKFIDEHKDKLVDFPPDQMLKESRRMASQAQTLTKLAIGKDEVLSARITRQAELFHFLALALTSQPGMENSSMSIMSFRDKCMAENIVKGSKSLFPGQKMMVWAHNGHVMRLSKPDSPKSMGAFLADSIGKRYYPIGFSFAFGSFNANNISGELTVHKVDGPKANSLDAILAKTGQEVFFVPTRPGIGEFDSRSIGAVYNAEFAERYFVKFDPAVAFAGLIYVRKTTPTHLLKQ